MKAGTHLSDPSLLPDETTLKTDLDLWRGAGGSWSVNLSPVSGFPAIVVPAGFTQEVYDRVPDAKDPNGSRLEGPKPDQIPVSMEFLARPFDEVSCSKSPSHMKRVQNTGARRKDLVRSRESPERFKPQDSSVRVGTTWVGDSCAVEIRPG